MVDARKGTEVPILFYRFTLRNLNQYDIKSREERWKL